MSSEHTNEVASLAPQNESDPEHEAREEAFTLADARAKQREHDRDYVRHVPPRREGYRAFTEMEMCACIDKCRISEAPALPRYGCQPIR